MVQLADGVSDAHAGPGGGPVTAFGRLARGLHPTFELLRASPPLVTPAVVVGALSLVTVAATIPLIRTAYAGRPELLPTVVAGLWLTAGLSPFVALIKGVVLGGVAWSCLVLTSAEARFRSLVSTLLYAQVFLVLQGTWMTALLWIHGTARLHTPGDMLLPTGLDLWFPDSTTVMGAVAHGVTPFHLAWLIFSAVVIGRLAHGSQWRGILAATSLWVLVAGVGVVRAIVT
ncbi:MAG: hypothetical protein LJF04_19460 [Gemmatimonadetes bacterium]|nr:hypothetical protein [Gemmatimonadota bacterium]